MSTQVEIRGLKELRRALETTVPQHFRGKVLQKALFAGARPVVAAARALAPTKTGTLRRAIYAFRDKAASSDVFQQILIGVRSGKRFQKSNKDAYYWRFIEFGRGAVSLARVRQGISRVRATYHGKSIFRDAKHKVLGTPKKGFFGTEVAAAPARPFLRPAFDRTKHQAVEALKQALAAEIPKAAKKASWRTP